MNILYIPEVQKVLGFRDVKFSKASFTSGIGLHVSSVVAAPSKIVKYQKSIVSAHKVLGYSAKNSSRIISPTSHS